MTEPQSIEAIIRNRRTIHEFESERLPDDALINRAIALARWAPNHHLTEPWHFYRIGPETKAAICRLNAEQVAEKNGTEAARQKLQRWQAIPGWLLVSCDVSADARQQQEDLAAVACAIHNFSLFLWSRGVGVKWSTGNVIRHPQFAETVWLDLNRETPVGLLWYGYPLEIPRVNRSNVEACMTQLP